MKTTGNSPSGLTGRSSPEKLSRQIKIFDGAEWNRELGDAMPLICLILNARRQVVYANRKVLEHLEVKDFQCVYGKRPGELFNCVHVDEGEDGCGTAAY